MSAQRISRRDFLRSGVAAAIAIAIGQRTILAGASALSAWESDAIAWMREEEKLAHDVYVTLYAKWRLTIFANISQSEQMHMDAVKGLITTYRLADPASKSTGVFTNPVFQKLYPELIAQGYLSIGAALKVGCAIEEIDILDLQRWLQQVSHTDIQNVFNHLMNGSFCHLRSFVSQLQSRTGEVYKPQYLSQEAYLAIIGSGGGGGGGRGGCR